MEKVLGLVHVFFASTGRRDAGRSALRFDLLVLIELATDWILFVALVSHGFGLGASHIASYGAAILVSLLTGARRINDGPSLARLAVLGLAALFLRGGVLAVMACKLGWPAGFAILPAILAAEAVNRLGAGLFGGASDQSKIDWRATALGIAGYLVALRLIYLGLPNLIPEEAYYWNYAQHLDIGYLDHPLMVAWLAKAGTLAFGSNEFGVRFGAWACWFLLAFFCFRFARNLHDESTAWVAVILVQALPFFFLCGSILTPDSPLAAFWIGALFFLERALLGEKRGAWWGVGACFGLGLLSKYTIALLGLATLIFVLWDRPSRRWLLNWRPYLAAVGALLIFSPVIIWNARHGWASFVFQGSHRLEQPARFSLHMLGASMLVLLTPVGVAAAGLILFQKPARGDAGLDPANARRSLFVKVFTLVPLAVFVAFSLRHPVKLDWTGPIWLAVIPAVAATIQRTNPGPRERIKGAPTRRLWICTILLAALAYGGVLHYLSLGLPGTGYRVDINLLPVGWSDLGRQIAGKAEALQATQPAPLIVGMDKNFISSEIAFYSRDRLRNDNITGRHLFGRDSLMYEYWLRPAAADGRTLMLVSFSPSELSPGRIERQVSRLGEIEEGSITRDGKFVKKFFYRWASDYHSLPAEISKHPSPQDGF